MIKNIEKRAAHSAACEIRAASETSAGTIAGYAALFDTQTTIAGSFTETIARGAFSEALKTSDVHALHNHDYGAVMGRVKSKTLRIKEDAKGLYFEVDLPATQQGRDLAALVARGDVDQASFQFNLVGGKQSWDESGDLPARTIERVGELFDVSICPRGAYSETSVSLRDIAAPALESLDEYRKQKKQHNFSAAARRLAMKVNLELYGRE